MCTGPHPQQELGKVPATTHIGPSPPGISNPAVQVNQHYNQPTHHYITSPTGSPNLPPILPLTPSSHCPSWWGAHNFLLCSLLMVSTHVSQVPPLLICNKSYTSAILVSFFIFIC